MLCRRCERRLWSPRLMNLWTVSRGVWGARRLGDLLCARCGALLPAELVTERLLGKLSELGRFGLAGSPKPLLERAEEDREGDVRHRGLHRPARRGADPGGRAHAA